jgi:hypothetical protein
MPGTVQKPFDMLRPPERLAVTDADRFKQTVAIEKATVEH